MTSKLAAEASASPPLPAAPRAASGPPPVDEHAADATARRGSTGEVDASVAAFILLLSRYGGEDEVEVRIRTADGVAPLRVDLGANPSAGAFTARVGEALANPQSSVDSRTHALPHARTAVLAVEEADGPAPVGIALRAGTDGVLALDADGLAPDAAARLRAHYAVVCDALRAQPERGILELPLLTPGEQAERRRWNATDADLPHGVCLHEAFEARADDDPHATAILYGDESITYAELEARANRLAHHLRRRGIGPERRVGICLERGPRVVEAFLAVLKAGGAYVPLDPAYPPERLAHMMATAGVRVLVTDAARAASLPQVAERILLDADAAAVGAESDARPEGGATPENLAYVVFTSGSTGQPKGIAVAHRGVMNNVLDMNGAHGIGPADRILLLSSLSFDMSVTETLGMLAAGGAIVIPRPAEATDPAAWAALCRRHGVTVWNSVPARLGMLSDHAEAHPELAPTTLRLAFLGGDWIPVPLADRVRAWAPALRDFIVLGGNTEVSIFSLIYPVREVDPAWRSIPYGVPMANQRAWVLDRHLREVPVGVAGELFLGGIGVTRGYTGRAGFTADRFLPDPHGGEPGARVYRTGDRARFGADGVLELLGRIDDQVKIRGFRIEPGEIEAALRRHPAVSRAVVVARADGGENRLVAYLLPADTAAPPSARELRDRLRETLPDFMVPAAYVVLDRLPLSPNGKVDRAQLPAPAAEAERAPYAAPRTPMERTLAVVWAEVLGVERVGIHDDFFALGGQSLMAARVVARVREACGAELGLRALFEAPTLAELAAHADGLRGADGSASAVVPVPRDEALPLSSAQERLWFLDRLQPGSAFYNLPIALRLDGALDVPALERAMGGVVARHEALRTTFAERDGVPVQVIAPFRGFVLPVEDLSALDADAREAEAARRATEDAARPFDLAAGPLFRASLLRLAEDAHVLLLNFHHIVGDGWSTDIFFRELSALYAEGDGGTALPGLPLQYADFAAWERARLRGDALDRQLAYWTERLAGAPALLELPSDHRRPSVQSHRGGREQMQLDGALVDGLAALGREEGATLFMVLLAAFQTLLHRYAGTDDVVVGSPIAGRTRPEVEGLIGLFVNTLALRTDLSGDPRFREVLRRARTVTLGAYEHADVPFERLVEELRPARSLGHSPLVQVLFALHEPDPWEAGFAGLDARMVEAEARTTKLDLVLQLTPTAGGLRAELEYASDLFAPGTARRILAHFQRVLEQAAAHPELRVSALDLLDDDERRQVLQAWNATDAPYPSAPIHHLFAEQAARTPDAAALVFGDAKLTYGELDARANRLANHLVALGAGAETRVAVSLEPGVEMVVAFLAILKAGGAYVPLDPAYPAERLAFMLADSGAALLVTRDALRDALPARDGVRIVSIDSDAGAIEAAGDAAPPVAADAGQLAYVIYTSGSTGTPKGVAVEHRAVVRLVRGADFVQLGAEDRVAQASSASFDAATFEIWGALLNGAALVGIPRDVALTPAELARTIRTQRITTAFLTTALFNQVARELPDAFAPLRHLLFGGEAVDPDAVRRVLAAGGPARLLHVYGPTENTTFSSWHLVSDVPAGAATVPIGRAVANSSLLVLDASLRPVPVGMPGELYVGGDGLARGYLGRPALTAERFIPHPFASTPGARLYRTGDRVRWIAEGAVEYLGRLDGQVKIRGFRIEPGEVEAALRGHPAVRECIVLVREDVPGERRLVAYVAGEVDADTLRAHLRASLPDYMVPGAVVVLDALPLNRNGKVDRDALPSPATASADASGPAPRTPVEEVLAGIFAEVLRVDSVGVRDDFFALGGHSLLATRVVSRVGEVFGVEATVRVLFEAPTVAALAERVEALRQAESIHLPPLVPVPRTGALPLSFAQEGLWFLDRLRPGSAFYTVPVALRLRGALDVPVLERALGEVIRRHEALRTAFPEVNGAPVQFIHPFTGFVLPVEDVAADEDAGDDDGREAAARRRAAEEAVRPFDLAAGPLFRPALLRLAADDHLLLLHAHHAVTDEWSMGVLVRELSALYAAFRDGAPSPLAEPSLQYADFAVWQRAQLRGDVLERELAYWRERLDGAPALLELPTDHPRPASQSYRGALEPLRLPSALAERLRALGRGEGATLYMVMLAAFQMLLSKYSGSRDVVVGSPMAARTRREVEEVVGFFTNTVALRTDLSGDPDFREVLRRVRGVTLGAYEHQAVPFERVVEDLAPERSASYAPVFQVMFVQEEAERLAGDLAGVRLRREDADSGTSKFDLTLSFAADEDGIGGSIEYATDLFERATIQRMLGHLARVLDQVAEDADRPISAVELMAEDERRLVVSDWNATDAPYPSGQTIHQLFQAQAARTPDAVALLHERASLTYRELNERANRLAHHLVRRGVGPETRVGICLERGVEMVAAILAVLKAGGAYVPLDPAYPAERLAFMLADSGAAVLLTQDALRGILPARDGLQVVSVDAARDEIAAERADDPEGGAGPRNLAYLIYTSGSTGVPKGVAIEHRNAAALLGWAWSVFTAEELDGVLASTSICFDLSVYELFVPLGRGGRIVLVENALALPKSAAAGEVRMINTVPSAIAALLKTGGIPAGVRTVNLAGEPLEQDVVDALYALDGIQRVYDLYGPSEDTTYSTGTLRRPGGVANIGRAISNTQAYVLDAALRPVPIGVAGELYLGGAGVARGYLGRPSLTAERWIPDPFAAAPGARLYRTGDAVRWTADGTLQYRGRLDAQVKVRGFRVELGEVEAAIRAAGVAECVVVAREDVPGDRRLVAYVAGGTDVDALRASLRRTLPEYMVPSAFVGMDALPLTPNGKLDRKALPPPDAAAPADAYVAPRNATEEVLAGIWREVLARERIGVRDNFFQIGGQSLLAARVVARIQDALDVEVDVVAFFEHPTIDQFVHLLSTASAPRPESWNAAPVPGTDSSPQHLLSVMDELSDEELDRLLAGDLGG
jgi:amino acid adenylation domain-containing protein